MPERITCCVPFCRRTYRNDEGYEEWICQPHWRLVPKRLKRRKRTAEKIYDRANQRLMRSYEERGEITDMQLRRMNAARDLARLAWKKCRQTAIENSAGI